MRIDRTDSSTLVTLDSRGDGQNQRTTTSPCDYPYYVSEPRHGYSLVGDPSRGDKLADRFTIESCLGQGSMGAVYLVVDDLRSMRVALKVVPVTCPEIASRLRHEIEQNSVVTNHEHVIHVYDIHNDKRGGVDLLLISMEYADGGSLRQWLVRNRDNVTRRRTEGVAYVVQACRGLRALHQAGILHLDLKPENLLLVRGILKIADLGLSRCTKAVRRNDGPSADGRDRSWVGTPTYMSREQLMPACASRVNERSDIYSIGAILFEMCDGQCQPPFVGSYEEIREAHLHMPGPYVTDVQAHVARAISKCLQEDPADRYANVHELIDELEGRSPAADKGPEIHQEVPEVEQLWRQACDFVQVGNLNSASRVCTEILERFPECSDARYLLQDIRDRFETAHQFFYVAIQRGIGCQPFARLLTMLAGALETYPDHPEGPLVQIELAAAMEENGVVMQNAAGALRQGHWQVAQSGFERASQLNPGQPVVVQAIEFVKEVQRQIQTAHGNIEAAIEQGHADRALHLARNLDKYIEQAKAFAGCLQQQESDHDTGT